MSKNRRLSRSGPRGGSIKNLYSESTTSTKKTVKSNKPREAGVTATWQAVGSFVSDFKSEYGATYTKNPLAVHPTFEPQAQTGFETERVKMQDKVITKLDSIAQKRYGSMRSMLAAFKKRPDDVITLDEFSDHLKKRHLDTLFPREEQRLLFDRLASNENCVSLTDLLNHCSQTEKTKETGPADDMRYTIADKLDDKRKESKLVMSARQTKMNLATNLRNLDPQSTGYVSREQMVWAMGNDFMKLKMTKDEARKAIEDIAATNKHIVDPTDPEKINYFRFVRALRISEPANDVNLFFDERERQIHSLKARVRTLEKESSNAELFARKEYLENELGIGLSGLQRYLAPIDTLQTSQSLPTLTMTSDDISDHRPGTAPSPDAAARTLTPIRVNNRPHRNSTTKQIGGQFKRADNEYTRDEVLLTTTTTNDATSYFKATTNHAAKTRLKDPSLVVLEQAHRAPKESHAVGKRRLPMTNTDWNRIGFGGNSYNNGTDLLESPTGFSTMASNESFNTNDDRFTTTSKAYFAELKYEPSKPVRRDVISDAELAVRKKKERLKRRHERTAANLKVIEQHIELDKISKDLAQANVNLAKAQDVLKYETTVFLNDLKAFSKREVETRHRKTNDAMSNRMWGGQVHDLIGGDGNRDFSTTYSNTYVVPTARGDAVES